MRSPILFVLAILLPSSLCAVELIKTDFKVLKSVGHEIPHDLAKAQDHKDIEIFTLPSVLTESDREQKSMIYRELCPKSVIKQDFAPARLGTQLSVTPRMLDGDRIAFSAVLTISEMVQNKTEEGRFQTEIQSKVIYLSAIQKIGEEGWFNLIDTNEGETNEKTTVMIRLSLNDDPSAAEAWRMRLE